MLDASTNSTYIQLQKWTWWFGRNQLQNGSKYKMGGATPPVCTKKSWLAICNLSSSVSSFQPLQLPFVISSLFPLALLVPIASYLLFSTFPFPFLVLLSLPLCPRPHFPCSCSYSFECVLGPRLHQKEWDYKAETWRWKWNTHTHNVEEENEHWTCQG